MLHLELLETILHLLSIEAAELTAISQSNPAKNSNLVPIEQSKKEL